MRGLMVKDYKLMMKKKKYFVMFAVMAVFLSFSLNGSFITSYLTMVGLIMAVSTISLDEFDNGLPFLMTFPIRRKDYAMEKVLFSCICLVAFWLMGGILQVIVSTLTGKEMDIPEMAAEAVVFLLIFCIILAVLVPVELHFGMEKSRMAMLLIGGCGFVIGAFGPKLLAKTGIDLRPIEGAIAQTPSWLLMLIGIVITAAALFLSVVVTTKVMEKKEF
ncbi:MAG: ABC-2 transporter permease [Lachnospiraceae bacterium]|nr:ABC-2 transporter permease [Lachnospiraceae bacterium]